jgi:hypothetical protein
LDFFDLFCLFLKSLFFLQKHEEADTLAVTKTNATVVGLSKGELSQEFT